MFPYPTRGCLLLWYSIWLRCTQFTRPNHNIGLPYAGEYNPNNASLNAQTVQHRCVVNIAHGNSNFCRQAQTWNGERGNHFMDSISYSYKYLVEFEYSHGGG
eukprot:490760_1